MSVLLARFRDNEETRTFSDEDKECDSTEERPNFVFCRRCKRQYTEFAPGFGLGCAIYPDVQSAEGGSTAVIGFGVGIDYIAAGKVMLSGGMGTHFEDDFFQYGRREAIEPDHMPEWMKSNGPTCDLCIVEMLRSGEIRWVDGYGGCLPNPYICDVCDVLYDTQEPLMYSPSKYATRKSNDNSRYFIWRKDWYNGEFFERQDGSKYKTVRRPKWSGAKIVCPSCFQLERQRGTFRVYSEEEPLNRPTRSQLRRKRRALLKLHRSRVI